MMSVIQLQQAPPYSPKVKMPSVRKLLHVFLSGRIAGTILAAVVVFLPASTVWADTPSSTSRAQTVEEGRYLAAAGDCSACHTAQSGSPYAGGAAIHTPFGTLLGPNLTPDRDTGIGAWTDDQFVQAVKQGRGHDGEHLFPGMPYLYFNAVPRSDILKIFAYLKSLPPVHNKVVADQLSFPFNIRASMIGWNWMFFHPKGDFTPDPLHSAQWNRGAYLVEGLGHCAACHTGKNTLGGDLTQRFQGGVIDGMNAPSLINDAHNGIGPMTAKEIAEYLKFGHNQYALASGPMAEVVTLSTSKLTMQDDLAIGVYLKSLQPRDMPAAPPPLATAHPQMQPGRAIYSEHCAMCHTPNGTGIAGAFPALKGNPVVTASDPATVVSLLLHGGSNKVDPAAGADQMPAFGSVLDSAQIAAVATYIRNSWGNSASPVTTSQVSSTR